MPLDEAPEPADTSPFTAPAQVLDCKLEAERVRNALLELAPAQRDVLVLRFFEELGHAEVARRLGRTEQAVRALQYRALRQLRAKMRAA